MKNVKKGKIVACLDMGTSKLVCFIASITNNDEIKILGYGVKESKGVAESAISDMRLAQKSITNVVSEAERMAGFNIDRLMIGLSGSQVISTRKEVSVKIASEIVKTSDINNLANKIRSEYKKSHREIIHLIPLQYRIDDSTPVSNPRYMSGENLYAKFHIVSTSQTTVKNIENCLKRCQLSVNNYVVEPYASLLSCLSESENNLGTLLIDIGASSTSYCITIDGKLSYVGNTQLGGMHVTKDIATILNIPFEIAEKIKSLNSSLLISPLEERELINLKSSINNEGLATIRITRAEFRDIMKYRIEEIFDSVKANLEKAGVPLYILSNVILTGGAASTIGIDKLASEIFAKAVRVGYPNQLNAASEFLNTGNACSLGMLAFLKNMYLREKIKSGFESKSSWFRRLIEKLAS